MGCTSSQELAHQPPSKASEAPKEVDTGRKSSNADESANKVDRTEPSIVSRAVKEETLSAEESPAAVPEQAVEAHTEQDDSAPVAAPPEEHRTSTSSVPLAAEASEVSTEPRRSSTNEASPNPAVAHDEPVVATNEGEYQQSVIATDDEPETIENINPSDLSLPIEPAPAMKRGTINKRGHVIKNWKNRHFVLDEGVLSYYESSSLSPPYGLGLKGQITLQNCELLCEKEMLIIRKTSSTASEKKNGHNELYLHIKYPNEREEWVDAIQSHIDFYNR